MALATCPSLEDLSALRFGKLPDSAAQEIAEHLVDCPGCQLTIESISDSDDTLASSLRHPPSEDEFENEPEFGRAMAAIEAMGPKLPSPVEGVQNSLPSGDEQSLGTVREYQLLEELGEGGMGTVYKARHAKLKRIVALKVLPRDRTRDAQAIARFEREMEAVGKVEHPNIVRALDAGEHEGTHYLVMEYVDGMDLSKLVQRVGKLPIADACELIRQAAVALQHVHEHGLVHRDIKPSNLMLIVAGTATAATGAGPATADNTRGQVKLLDLGLALLGGLQPSAKELTATNQMMGTADYIAPEQAGDSHAVDIRADVYSLGCTLYKLLTGEAPFSGAKYGSSLQKMLAHLNEPIPPVTSRRAEVPSALVAVLDRMIAKKPSDRFGTPAEVAAAIAPFCAGSELARLASSVANSDAEAIATANTDPFLTNSMTGTHPTASVGNALRGVSPADSSLSPVPCTLSLPSTRRPFRRVLIAAAAASLLILGGIVVIIKNGQGQPVARVKLAEGRGATIKEGGKPVATIAGNGSKPDAEIDLAPGTTATFNIDNGEKPDGKQADAESPREITPLHRIRFPEGERFSAVDVSQDGRYFLASRLGSSIASLTSPNRTRVYEMQTGNLVRELQGWIARFTPSGKYVVTVGFHEFYVFDLTTSEVVRIFEGRLQCWLFYLSNTGTRLFNATPQESQVWDWSTGKKLSSYPVKQDWGILVPDGQYVLFQSGGKPRLQAYDAETGERVEAYQQLRDLPADIGGFSGNGKRLMLQHGPIFKAYDVGTGKEVASIDAKLGRAVLSGDGRLVLASVYKDGAYDSDFGIWDVDGGRRRATLRFPETLPQNVSPCLTPDAKIAAFVVADSVYVFRLPDLAGGSKAKMIVDKPGKQIDNAQTAKAPNAPPPGIAPFDAQQAKAHQEAWAKHLGTEVEITNSVGMKLRLIPPGEFTMGSSREEIDALTEATAEAAKGLRNVFGSEVPKHRVRLTNGFYMGSHEVTQKQYQEVMGVNPSWNSLTGPGKDAVNNLDTGQHPVDSVSWFDAIDFCNKLSEKDGLPLYYQYQRKTVTLLGGTGYRLPTEGEWEYACRAGTTTRWSVGDSERDLGQNAWIASNANVRTQRVGELPANPFGLYDLYGNVLEWCWDWHGVYPDAGVSDPTGSLVGSSRVLRGGAFSSNASVCRSAVRGACPPMSRYHGDFGFRVTRSIAGTADTTKAAFERASANEDPKWAEHTQHLPFVIGYENGLAEANAKNKPLMFFITTTWCAWCTKHAQENFNDEAVRSLLDKFVLVIVDGDTEPEALAALDAKRGFPHLIFQSAAGERLAEQVGYAPVDVFTKVVEDALAKAGSAVPRDEPAAATGELPVKPEVTFQRGDASIEPAKTTPDGKIGVKIDGLTAQLYDVASGQEIGTPLELDKANGYWERNKHITAWAFNADGTMIAVAASWGSIGKAETDAEVYIWQVETRQLLVKTNRFTREGGYFGWVHRVGFSADGKTLRVHCEVPHGY